MEKKVTVKILETLDELLDKMRSSQITAQELEALLDFYTKRLKKLGKN